MTNLRFADTRRGGVNAPCYPPYRTVEGFEVSNRPRRKLYPVRQLDAQLFLDLLPRYRALFLHLRERLPRLFSCYGSAIGSKEKADHRFIELIDELQAALPSDRWRGVETEPRIDSMRSYSYEDQDSDAHIDIDLIGRPQTQGTYSYLVTIFGWTATYL